MNRQQTNRPSFGWLIAVSALSLGIAAPDAIAGDHAGSRFDPPSVTVSYADLDLNKPAGAEALYSRIEGAARFVCGGRANRRDLARYRHYRQCYDEAVDDAVNQINHKGLFAVHYRKSEARRAS